MGKMLHAPPVKKFWTYAMIFMQQNTQYQFWGADYTVAAKPYSRSKRPNENIVPGAREVMNI